jgi:hypothetical protein
MIPIYGCSSSCPQPLRGGWDALSGRDFRRWSAQGCTDRSTSSRQKMTCSRAACCSELTSATTRSELLYRATVRCLLDHFRVRQGRLLIHCVRHKILTFFTPK